MNIRIVYFARFRESLGLDEEQLQLSVAASSVQEVLQALLARGGRWTEFFSPGRHRVLAAVNQQMVGLAHPLASGDKLALFPPVTGG